MIGERVLAWYSLLKRIQCFNSAQEIHVALRRGVKYGNASYSAAAFSYAYKWYISSLLKWPQDVPIKIFAEGQWWKRGSLRISWKCSCVYPYRIHSTLRSVVPSRMCQRSIWKTHEHPPCARSEGFFHQKSLMITRLPVSSMKEGDAGPASVSLSW